MEATQSPNVETATRKLPQYDDTDLFELVSLVCELTARDLKNMLVTKGPLDLEKLVPCHFTCMFAWLLIIFDSLGSGPLVYVEVSPKSGGGGPTRVDLVKLAKFLPTHLIAAVCKNDSHYWLDGHMSRGLKSLLHLTRLGKKKPGPLEQEIHANLKKYVDLCFFTLVRCLRFSHAQNLLFYVSLWPLAFANAPGRACACFRSPCSW